MLGWVMAIALQAPQAGDAQGAAPLLEHYATARAIADSVGERVWPGFSEAPFQILLIEGETETLVCGEGPGEGFTPAGIDPATGCETATRGRQFDPAFLASFPAVDGIPTIVVGTPQATGLTPSRWMFTLLHEHLHQMQDAQPGVWEGVLALDLHDGDTTGMWMLNYPFPYDDPDAGAALRALADAAAAALDSHGERTFSRPCPSAMRATGSFSSGRKARPAGPSSSSPASQAASTRGATSGAACWMNSGTWIWQAGGVRASTHSVPPTHICWSAPECRGARPTGRSRSVSRGMGRTDQQPRN